MIFGVLRADLGTRFVNAKLRLDASLGCAFEEAKDVLAMFVFGLFSLLCMLLRCLFGRVLVNGFVDLLV